jgi:hypothetical protein
VGDAEKQMEERRVRCVMQHISVYFLRPTGFEFEFIYIL